MQPTIAAIGEIITGSTGAALAPSMPVRMDVD